MFYTSFADDVTEIHDVTMVRAAVQGDPSWSFETLTRSWVFSSWVRLTSV